MERITNIRSLRSLSGSDQQITFYRIYKRHQKDGAVSAKSFRYLAWRDTASLYFFLGILTVPVAYTMSEAFTLQPAIKLTAFAIVAYLLTAIAARLTANDLVGQVLSCEAAEHPHAIN